ncbi:DNA-binding response regulator [Lachnospiraceae bacterium TF09-5]|nr:DNA-binding response regulator [Lachnospiraceae bacterium TF09-5]
MNHIIKVTLAEDGDALRRSLADSLREQPDISVLGEAAEGGELVALCRETPPDVAVVDIRMPGMDGVAACKILRSELPEVRLLILTTFDDDEYLRELFGLGVDGYLLKTGSPPRLAEAVRGVYNGLGAVDAGISRKLGSLLNAPKKPGTGPLTETELRAARLIAKGKYNKEIAVELGITYGRTRNLVSAVYRKLGAVDRADLIAKLEKG